MEWARSRIWKCADARVGTPTCPCCNASLVQEVKRPRGALFEQSESPPMVLMPQASINQIQVRVMPQEADAENQLQNQNEEISVRSN